MRVQAFLSLSILLLAGATYAVEEHKDLVERAVRAAEAWYENSMKEAMVSGAQSKRSTKYPLEAEEHDKEYTIYNHALDALMTLHNLTEHEAHRGLRQVSGTCQTPTASCASSRYRSADGTCNNLNTAWWGAARSFQNRLLNPVYADGRNAPRGGIASSLPNARFISTQCHPDFDVVFPGITNMVPQFGQFVDHDLSLTPEGNKQCCANPSTDANCWGISVPTNDYFFAPKGTRCLDFTRSTACSNPNSGVREQMNMNTAFIDGSQIYGSAATRTNQLRSFQGGRLITNSQGWNGFLPFGSQTSTLASNNVQGAFIAGDDRINEMPGLAVMHNVFLMEHNRIAAELARLRPAWSDETLFQETRRIVGAELQNIVYQEYLPSILGDATMRAYNLYLPAPGQFSSYDGTVNPTIINSFSTAAYRFGHSLINGIVRLFDVSGTARGSYQIKDQYFQADQMTQSNGQGYDWILKGLMETNSQKFDPFVTTGVTNFLFAPRGATMGSDLVARNIQRGRDHGLPNYNAFRSACGRAPVDFNTQPADMDSRVWNVMKTCYASPDQIDLFSGGLSELPVAGGASGFTFNCIKAIQFDRLKRGDRYFFTHSNGAAPFTSTQLTELRRRRLGDVICQNSQQVSTQANVFLIPGTNNPRIACTDASRKLNLSLFV